MLTQLLLLYKLLSINSMSLFSEATGGFFWKAHRMHLDRLVFSLTSSYCSLSLCLSGKQTNFFKVFFCFGLKRDKKIPPKQRHFWFLPVCSANLEIAFPSSFSSITFIALVDLTGTVPPSYIAKHFLSLFVPGSP